MSLHIANTCFEWELIQKSPFSIVEALHRHPIFLQLQFLPFLYAAQEDAVAVTAHPPEAFWDSLQEFGITPHKLQLFSAFCRFIGLAVESWGASRAVEAWAKEKRLRYDMPPQEIVRMVHSKEFSFTRGPRLPGSMLLHGEKDAHLFLAAQKKPFVLKRCFGLSGKGHLLVDHPAAEARVWPFLKGEWREMRPVIAEPWVERVLDFSTQWRISKTEGVHYLGVTICDNDKRGRYVQNRVGGICIPHLEEHRAIAIPILEEMADRGYFGHAGIDALLYLDEGSTRLHPIVEINARKTMGWVALEMQRRHFPNRSLTLRYAPSASGEGVLPSALGDTLFTRQLMIFTDKTVSWTD